MERSSLPRFEESAVMSGGIRRNRISGHHRSRGAAVRRSKDSCCCYSTCSRCNSQICCSYLLALISSGLVVAGVYISLWRWNRVWLILSASGLVLTLFGACMYYCGTEALAAQYSDDADDEYDDECNDDEDDGVPAGVRVRRKRKKRFRGGDDHLPSASDAVSRSLSQLSLNMIPQYFSPSDTNSTLLRHNNPHQNNSTSTSGGVPFSQIFSVNGQSYLILPLTGDCVGPPTPVDLNLLNPNSTPLVNNGSSGGATGTTGDVCIPLESLVSLSSKMPKNNEGSDHISSHATSSSSDGNQKRSGSTRSNSCNTSRSHMREGSSSKVNSSVISSGTNYFISFSPGLMDDANSSHAPPGLSSNIRNIRNEPSAARISSPPSNSHKKNSQSTPHDSKTPPVMFSIPSTSSALIRKDTFSKKKPTVICTTQNISGESTESASHGMIRSQHVSSISGQPGMSEMNLNQRSETTLIDLTGLSGTGAYMGHAGGAAGGAISRRSFQHNLVKRTSHPKSPEFYDDEVDSDDDGKDSQGVLGAEAPSANYYEDFNFTLEDEGDFLDESEFSPPPSYAEVIDSSDLHQLSHPNHNLSAAAAFLSPVGDMKTGDHPLESSDHPSTGTL